MTNRLRDPKHPPFLGPDIWTNIALLTDTTCCTGATHFHDLSMSLLGFGKTAYGAVFQLNMISGNFVVITDYKLARIVLAGDPSQGINEAEKTTIGRAFDLFPNIGSIFSSLTSDIRRQKARKFFAPCFSFTNLKYTFTVIMNSLTKCQKKLKKYAKEDFVFELNDVMIKLTFDVITESSFGVNWNTQVDDIVSDGTLYLYESDVRLREGYRRTFNPIRKYCFWLSDYKRHQVAVDRVTRVLRKVVSDYEKSEMISEAGSDQSIMGHIMNHNYENDDMRITDMNTFLIAGKCGGCG